MNALELSCFELRLFVVIERDRPQELELYAVQRQLGFESLRASGDVSVDVDGAGSFELVHEKLDLSDPGDVGEFEDDLDGEVTEFRTGPASTLGGIVGKLGHRVLGVFA